jgi:fructokinase
MNVKASNPSVVCFGELLWDNLPTGRRPGGAPMNVAYHLNKLGTASALVSAVGRDEAGQELLQFVSNKGIDPRFIQSSVGHDTSEVLATVGADHEVKYDIVQDVAWDYIEPDPKIVTALETADAFVYGSLSSRSVQSRKTLFALLQVAKYRVFDVNLRAPHYSPDLIQALMEHANLLKVNAAELQLIASWNGIESKNEAEIIKSLFDGYAVQDIVVTRGSDGASYFNRTESIRLPAYPVEVQDTIGSGDSFLAALLSKRLQGIDVHIALDTALAMGSFVTGQAGACPDYQSADFERFMLENQGKAIR